MGARGNRNRLLVCSRDAFGAVSDHRSGQLWLTLPSIRGIQVHVYIGAVARSRPEIEDGLGRSECLWLRLSPLWVRGNTGRRCRGGRRRERGRRERRLALAHPAAGLDGVLALEMTSCALVARLVVATGQWRAACDLAASTEEAGERGFLLRELARRGVRAQPDLGGIRA